MRLDEFIKELEIHAGRGVSLLAERIAKEFEDKDQTERIFHTIQRLQEMFGIGVVAPILRVLAKKIGPVHDELSKEDNKIIVFNCHFRSLVEHLGLRPMEHAFCWLCLRNIESFFQNAMYDFPHKENMCIFLTKF
ncbi:MAG: hypothetical protein ACK4SM_03275 [Aquificaceae bacterium]